VDIPIFDGQSCAQVVALVNKKGIVSAKVLMFGALLALLSGAAGAVLGVVLGVVIERTLGG
jgi:hypothetical protein